MKFKNLKDMDENELDAIQNALDGFIYGFGIKWAKDYKNLIVCAKAQMEQLESDLNTIHKRFPETDVNAKLRQYLKNRGK